MAYDERLAGRIRKILEGRSRVTEQKMFGGIAFMVRGHMCCGVVRDRLVVRVGSDQYDEALSRTHAEPMDFTGRPLRGLVYVRPEGLRGSKQLSAWVAKGLEFVRALPAKRKRKR